MHMSGRTIGIAGLALFFASGCVGTSGVTQSMANTAPTDGIRDRMSSVMESVQKPFKELAASKVTAPDSTWDWVTAAPSGATRAETILTTVADSSVRELLPEFRAPDIKLVSAGDHEAYRITAINGAAINDYNQLNTSAAQAVDSGKKVTITLTAEGGSQGPSSEVTVEPAKLMALTQAVSSREPLVRVSAEGNPWLLIREDGTRCKVMSRVERTRCLMHVAVSLGVCWGAAQTLPGDVQAMCDGVPLKCLTVSETLEALYGGPKKSDSENKATENGCSFRAVSEREDYLLPTNYKRLQHACDEAAKDSMAPPPIPAFATLPGLGYPGPAILGDARALSGFLLQRQIYQPGEPERVGWLVFQGDALRRGAVVQLTVELGHGPNHLTFSLPKQ